MAPNSKLNARRKAKREPAKAKQQAIRVEAPAAPSLPLELQQLLLNIFRNSFAERLGSNIDPLLQEVKGHLYNRDFTTAFGKNEYLQTYAARWSPSRALGYLDVFWDLRDHLWPSRQLAESEIDDKNSARKRRKVVCLGGGAGAEIVALAGLQAYLSQTYVEDRSEELQDIEAIAVDVADWTSVVDTLTEHIITPPPLNKYASAAAKATNHALSTSDKIDVTFLERDVFTAYSTDIDARLQNADLITLMFTLNELYSASLAATQKFLLSLTELTEPGSLLLVIDSPGSYSSVTLNGAEKKYPMQWLLDHTLLKQATTGGRQRGESEVVKWEKIDEDESRWFRLDSELTYPIELENMRMQLHLYRRI